MDGNQFGQINKLHGQLAGDQAIKAFGQAAREAMDEAVGRGPGGGKMFRHTDEQVLYRNGGDEFIANVPSHEHAAKFARLLSKKLQDIPAVGGTHKLSMSYGLGLDHETADKAQMLAKGQKYHDLERKQPKYPDGQVPNLAHSLVPGFEGPLPVHDAGEAAHHEVMASLPKAQTKSPSSVPSEAAKPSLPAA
jgi:hypothetical protein